MDKTTSTGGTVGKSGGKSFESPLDNTAAAVPEHRSSPTPFPRHALGDALGRRLWPLPGEALCAAARHRTGLEDFGDPPLEPALSSLTASLEHEADLHLLGRHLMRIHLRELLETRLQLVEAWSREEEAMAATPLQRPIFITGMPRSGSTFLHELLAADPGNRVPRVWEVLFPVPASQAKGSGRETWVRKAAARLWWFRHLAPQADSVHPLRADMPQECVAIHSYTFLSEEFLATCRLPGYEAFLHSADLRPVYLWQRRFLQYLQGHGPAKRWVLKSPDHVYGLEELFATFPDAVIIQTHRNPLQVLRSCIRLVQVLHGLFAHSANSRQLAAREARVLAEAMERFIGFRDSHPELAERFIDLEYSELVSDPLAAVRRIYQRLGSPLTQPAEERMRHLAASRSRYSGRLTAPALAELGVDVSAEAQRFAPYCFRFGIPFQ